MSDNPNAERDALITQWLAADKASKAAVEAERDLRASLVAMLFPNPVEGTNTYELGQGFKIKLTHSFSYKLGDSSLLVDGVKVPVSDQCESICNELEALGNEGALLASRLVVWKPELSVTEYKKLDETWPIQKQAKAVIDQALKTSPASPQVKFVEPSSGK